MSGGAERLQRGGGLGAGHIVRVAAGQCELRQLHGVGAVGGRLAGGDQLVGGGDLIPQDGGHLQKQIVGQGGDGRPLRDVGAILQRRVRLGMAEAPVHPLVVHGGIEPALCGSRLVIVHVCRGGEHTVVPGGGGDGAGVHEDHAGQLPIAGLGALPVGEVAGGVADGQGVVGGHVARAEAGAAEAGLAHGARTQQAGGHTVFHQLQLHGDGGRVHGEVEIPAAHVAAVQNGGGRGDVVVQAAGTPGDDALLHPELAVLHLVGQVQLHLAAELGGGALLHLPEHVAGVGDQLPQRHRLGGVEGQRGHRLDGGEIQFDQSVVVRAVLRMQGRKVTGASVERQIVRHGAVRLPDGGQAGRLGGHHVDADAVVHAQAADAVAHEFQHLVLHKAVFVHRAAQGDGHIVGAHAVAGLTGDVHQNDLRRSQIVGVAQQLLDDLAAALAHAQRAQRAIAGVAVGAENHFAAAGQQLPGVLVDDGLIRGHIVAAVLHRRRQAEGVVVSVDGAAHGAQAVVTVGEHIGHREFLQTTGLGGLDDTHIGDVVGDETVECQVQQPAAAAGVVGAEDAVGHGLVPRGLAAGGSRMHGAVLPDHAAVVQLYHHVATPFGKFRMAGCGTPRDNEVSIARLRQNARGKIKFMQVDVFLFAESFASAPLLRRSQKNFEISKIRSCKIKSAAV